MPYHNMTQMSLVDSDDHHEAEDYFQHSWEVSNGTGLQEIAGQLSFYYGGQIPGSRSGSHRGAL
jgi:hypothetical protein